MTNEHKGALALLTESLLKNTVVGDVAFCQRDLCDQILAAEGHSVLAVKRINPPYSGKSRNNSLLLTQAGLRTNGPQLGQV